MVRRLGWVFTLALFAAPAIFGQSLGGIVGDVKDSTGAVITGATVTVTNTDGQSGGKPGCFSVTN